MMKKILFLYFLMFSVVTFAQKSTDTKKLSKVDKQIALLQELGKQMIFEEEYEQRRDANYAFIKQFTRLLKQDNSYNIPLDELTFISTEKPEDDAFRIFTWQIETAPGLVRHYGAIQLNSKKLTLIPLTDRSDEMDEPELHIGDNEHWYGAIYYKVQAIKGKTGTKYYLYGYDSATPVSNKKVIDVMQVAHNRAAFGADVFPDIRRPGNNTATRFILEYKENATVRLNYSPELKKIVYDHLVPMNEANEGIFADYVPDGTYDALVMRNGVFYIESDIVVNATQPTPNDTQQRERPKSNRIYNSKAKK